MNDIIDLALYLSNQERLVIKLTVKMFKARLFVIVSSDIKYGEQKVREIWGMTGRTGMSIS